MTDLRPGGAQDEVIIAANGQSNAGLRVSVAAGPFQSRHARLHPSIRFHEIPHLQREISVSRDARALFELRRLIWDDRPQLIVTHLSKAAALVRLTAGAIPVVHRIHTFPFHPDQPPLIFAMHVALERLLARRTALYFASAPQNVHKALSNGIGVPSQYRVVYQAVDARPAARWSAASRSEVRKILGLPTGRPIVGTIARLVPQKAPLDFIEAARLVADVHPGVLFWIVGDGPMRASLEQAVKALDLHDKVVFAGRQESSLPWSRAFDVLVHTAVYEGFPRAIIDSMLVETPVVATAVDGVIDAIPATGERGLLAPPKDPGALARGVVRFLGDPDWSARVAGDARAWAETETNADLILAKVLKLYDQVLTPNDRRLAH